MLSKLIFGRSFHFLLHSLFQGSIFYYLFLPEALWCCSLHSSSRFVRTVFFSCLSISNRSVVPSFQVLPILSSFSYLLNRSAVWNLSDPLCHSFNSSGGSVLLISLSILSSCKVHVQFLPFTVGVLSKLYHYYSFLSRFNQSGFNSFLSIALVIHSFATPRFTWCSLFLFSIGVLPISFNSVVFFFQLFNLSMFMVSLVCRRSNLVLPLIFLFLFPPVPS